MVGRIGGEPGPLVVGHIISQWHVPEVAILQDRGIWRCRQFARNDRPTVLERFEAIPFQGDPLYVADVEH